MIAKQANQDGRRPPPAGRRMLATGAALLALALAAEATETTRVVALRPVPRTFAAEGTVEAVHQAVIAAQVAGRILEMRVDAGQQVGKGDLLARIDTREAAGNAEAAAAQLANAKAALDRARSLEARKFLSPAAVDKALADHDAARAASAAASAAAGHGRIHAPFAGVVGVRHAEAGEMAVPGRPILSLYQPGALRVSAALPQARHADLRNAREAWVEFPAADGGRRVAATGISILPTADPASRTLTVRLGLPADSAGGALPGAAARVHFVVGRTERMTVPVAAIVRRGEVTAVQVRAAGERWALRQVRLGETVADGEVEVLAGLTAGERIALDPVKAALEARTAGASR